MLITTEKELAAFCERAAEHPVLGVDTEFMRERTYYPRLCLLQMGTPEEQVAVDTIVLHHFEPVERLFRNPSVTKVFHAPSQDLEIIHNVMDVLPQPLFDTQLAAAFLGYRLQMGLGDLVETFAGVHLPKSQTLTDWIRRPLDSDQLEYALDDVRYLPGIYETMVDELVKRDRLGWVLPEMEAQARRAATPVDPEEVYKHVKRAPTLTRKQLAVLREVAEWREITASKRDHPRRWVLADEVLIQLARNAPDSEPRMRRLQGVQNLNSKDSRNLFRAVQRGIRCPEEDYPETLHKPRIPPERESVVDLMNAVLRIIADREGIASQLIATREDLQAFAAGKKGSALSEGWRHEIAGRFLERLLDGSMALTVRDGRIEMI